MLCSGDPYAARDVQMEVAVMKALRNSPYVLHVRAVAFAGPPGAEEEAFLLLDLCKDNLFSYLQVPASRAPVCCSCSLPSSTS